MSDIKGKKLLQYKNKDMSNWCRVCMTKKKPLWPLFKYKLSGNFAEMLTAIADVKVSADDGLPDKLCSKCCSSLEKAFILKTMAERSDKKLRMLLPKMNKKPTKKLAFNSLSDIKGEIKELNIKNEPKWDFDIEVLNVDNKNILDASNDDRKDIVIANTVIRKVDGSEDNKSKSDFFKDDPDITWKTKSMKNEDYNDDVEFLDETFFNDDDTDEDYVPLTKLKAKSKTKFKQPKLSEIKVFKDKPIVKRVKIINKMDKGRSSLITCYSVNKNGSRGQPIILKRPKDANNVKLMSGFKTKTVKVHQAGKVIKKEPKQEKPREKMVCPVCGILTYTLGNHMSTHQEKKKFNCTECPKMFSQKSNLLTHMKYHTGVKDHICEVCGAGFYCQKGLVRHNLIHTGERPYACSLCPKRFIARCDLNRHMKIHSGYKPFKCNMCTMSFNAKHQLQNHERMHTGERPYTCQVCNVSFSYKVNLNNHVAKMHGINLKFKSIHIVTEDVLRKEMDSAAEARTAIASILPPNLHDVPQPAAHETVHHTDDYSIGNYSSKV